MVVLEIHMWGYTRSNKYVNIIVTEHPQSANSDGEFVKIAKD
jgi:hypothetical protein